MLVFLQCTPPGSSWPLNFHLAFDLLTVSAILTTAVSLFLPQTIEKKRDIITTEHQTHYKQAVLVMYSTLLVTCPVTSVKLQIANYFLLTANPIVHDLKYHNRISSQPKVSCYLHLYISNWTGDQQSTV